MVVRVSRRLGLRLRCSELLITLKKGKQMWQRFKEIIFLLSLNFLIGNFGPLEPPLSRLTGLILLIGFVFFSIRRQAWKIHLKKTVTVFVLILILGLILLPRGKWVGVLGALVLVSILEYFLRSIGQEQQRLVVLLLAGVIYVFFQVFYHFNAFVWTLLHQSSVLFSTVITRLIGQKLVLGSTALGVQITVLALGYCVSVFGMSKERRASLLITSFLLVMATTVLYLWIQIPLVKLAQSFNRAFSPTAFHFLILLFLFEAVAISWTMRKVEYKECSLSIKKADLKFALPSLGLIFSVLLILTFSFPEKGNSRSMMFYEKGYLDWRVPNYESYGRYSHGMFGVLPEYLQEQGYEIRKHSDLITEQALQDVSILVVINLTQPFSKEEKQNIYKFVENGGALLALGDHTNVMGIMAPFNDLLRPFGIRLNFDTAETLVAGWVNGLYLRPHPIVRGIRAESETAIWVGASLSINLHASPVIIGRYGWSDKGNPNNVKQAYLGDRKLNLDEQLGDLILVAQRHYGKGKVLAFGDTSPFQNTALVESYHFVTGVFDWLSRRAMGSFHLHRIMIAILLLIPLGYFLRKMNVSVVFIFLCVLLITLAVLTAELSGTPNESLKASEGKIAYIDASHIERYTRMLWTDDSVSGLASNLVRAGYQPMFLKEFSQKQILNSRILIVIAPAKAFSKREREILKAFMAQGGLLIWSVGWEERDASEAFLREVGLALADVPLGPTNQVSAEEKVWFQEAWPILFEKPVQSLCKKWNYPVIVKKSYGKGGIILIGDSYFLLDQNLESILSLRIENIIFLKELFKKFNEGMLWQ